MVGILVHGNNHFVLSGPLPDEAAALALVRHWSILQIGEAKSSSFGQWQIRSKEFRENLEWAVIVPGDRETSPGVAQLLGELSARRVTIRRPTERFLGCAWQSTDLFPIRRIVYCTISLRLLASHLSKFLLDCLEAR
jgi:hypothetical protein